MPTEKRFAPTRTKPDVPRATTFQITKSQRYWLLKTHPEAFLGNVDLKGTISEHIRACPSQDDSIETQVRSLLAAEETSDLRTRSRAVSRVSLRRKVLRDTQDAFVVPDADEDDRQPRRDAPIKDFPKRKTIQLRPYFIKLMKEINDGFFGESSAESAEDNVVEPFDHIQEISENLEADQHIALQPLLGFGDLWHSLDLTKLEPVWNRNLERLSKSSNTRLFQCGTSGPQLDVNDFFERFSIDWSSRLEAESLTATQWRYMQLALERLAAEVYLSGKGIFMVPQSTLELASRAEPRKGDDQFTTDDTFEELPFSRAGSGISLSTPPATPASSRATSQVAESLGTQEEDDTSEQQEDPAVARLRMHLPSIKFTPPAKQGQSRLMSLWPEQRGSDPQNYGYSPTGNGADGLSQAVKRRREREEDRQRRKANRRAHLGLKLESSGDSFSQPHMPDEIRSSPLPQLFAKSQGQHQIYGDEINSQAQSQGQSIGPSQTMSQPLRGEFGTRPSKLRQKTKGKQKVDAGTRKAGFR